MRKWIVAARLRTLPLSISGIILGGLIAKSQGFWDWGIFILALLTTLLLQVLSNYANDYGDGVKGTDAKRIGEKRAVASGEISSKQMRLVVILFGVLAMLSAICLIILSFGIEKLIWTLIFLFLALASIWAAIKYTVGKNAYGYVGLGDLFVFLFFGWIAVIGTYILLQNESFFWLIFLPASSIGMLSIAVLNLNNMRDMETDKISNKITIPIRIGFKKAKTYQTILLIIPFVLSTIFILSLPSFKIHYLSFWILVIPVIVIIKKMHSVKELSELDGELKKVALLTLAFSLLLGISLNL